MNQLVSTDAAICKSLRETAASQGLREDTLSDHAAGSLLCEGVEHVVVLGFSQTRQCWNLTQKLTRKPPLLNGIRKLAPGLGEPMNLRSDRWLMPLPNVHYKVKDSPTLCSTRVCLQLRKQIRCLSPKLRATIEAKDD